MERYSQFKDPLTGINPFLQPKAKKMTAKSIAMAILRLPIYFLFIIGFPVLPLLITIKRKDKKVPKGLAFCNSVTEFDKSVLKTALGIECSNYLKSGVQVTFPEGTKSNNLSILKYEKTACDYSIGLRYNEECVYLYGSRLSWLFRFLGCFNVVEISVIEGNDLSKAAGIPNTCLGQEDKKRFLKLLSN